MSRSLVAGRVRGGERDGQTWLGVEGDNSAYDKVVGPLSGTVTHVLVIGDDAVVRRLVGLLREQLGDSE